MPKLNDKADVAEPAKPESKTEELEKLFQQHTVTAEKAKKEFLEAYIHLADDLSVDSMKPLADALIANGQGELEGQDNFIKVLQKIITRTMSNLMEQFWEGNNVTSNIASLEMLKEKFKFYEGSNRDIMKKTPEERIKPMLLHFKELQINKLQKQLDNLNAQQMLLAKQLQTTESHLHNISEMRIVLREAMQSLSMDSQTINSNLMREQEEMIRSQVDDDELIIKCDVETEGEAAAIKEQNDSM